MFVYLYKYIYIATADMETQGSYFQTHKVK